MIVLDLSQEQLASVSNTNTSATANNSILSDIIQATGIMPNVDEEIVGEDDTNQHLGDNRMQDNDRSDLDDFENYNHRTKCTDVNASSGEGIKAVNDSTSDNEIHLTNSSNQKFEVMNGKYKALLIFFSFKQNPIIIYIYQ